MIWSEAVTSQPPRTCQTPSNRDPYGQEDQQGEPEENSTETAAPAVVVQITIPRADLVELLTTEVVEQTMEAVVELTTANTGEFTSILQLHQEDINGKTTARKAGAGQGEELQAGGITLNRL